MKIALASVLASSLLLFLPAIEPSVRDHAKLRAQALEQLESGSPALELNARELLLVSLGPDLWVAGAPFASTVGTEGRLGRLLVRGALGPRLPAGAYGLRLDPDQTVIEIVNADGQVVERVPLTIPLGRPATRWSQRFLHAVQRLALQVP